MVSSYDYEVSFIPLNNFLIHAPGLQYQFTINYVNLYEYQISLSPLKTSTNILLLQNYVSIFNMNELLHLDASQDQISILPATLPFMTPDPAQLLTLYLSEKSDPFILKFKTTEERNTAASWLPRSNITDEQINKFKSLLPIKDRTLGFRKYKQCFIVTDAIHAIMNIWKCSRTNAVWIGRRLQQEFHFFEHVTGDHLFKDRYLYFRLTDSGISEIDSKNLFDNIYGGMHGIIDSTTRTVANYTRTDAVLDFVYQLQDEAKELALNTPNFMIQHTQTSDTIERKTGTEVTNQSKIAVTPKGSTFGRSHQTKQEHNQIQQSLTNLQSMNEFSPMYMEIRTKIECQFAYPENLKFVPELLKANLDARNANWKKCISHITFQVEQAKIAKNHLNNVNAWLDKNIDTFNSISDIIRPKDTDIPIFEAMKSARNVLNNLKITRDWIERMNAVQEEFLALQYIIREEYESLELKYEFDIDETASRNAYLNLDSSLTLLDVHLRIRSLSEFKLKALLELSQYKNLLQVFEDFFTNVDTLNLQFRAIIKHHSKNLIYYAGEGWKEKVIEILRIIEREERYEKEIRENADPIILERFEWNNYKELFFTSIRKNVKNTIRRNISKLPLEEKLQKLAESIEDLPFVKEYTKGLFPPHYEIVKFYVNIYEDEIYNFISKRTSQLKELSNGDNSVISDFLRDYEDYFDESILEVIGAPRDYSSLISQLDSQFVNNFSSRILDFSDNILKIVFSDKIQTIDVDNRKYSTGPIDLMKTITTQLDQALKRPNIASSLIPNAFQVFNYYCRSFEALLKAKLPTLSIFEICLFINDFMLLGEYCKSLAGRCESLIYELDEENLAKSIQTTIEKFQSYSNGSMVRYKDHFSYELANIIEDEISPISSCISKINVDELKSSLADLTEFVSDILELLPLEVAEVVLQKVDMRIRCMIIKGLIVEEPDITENMLDLLRLFQSKTEKILSPVDGMETPKLLKMLINFLTQTTEGLDASGTTQALLKAYPDINQEVFLSLLKQAKHINTNKKKEMQIFILPYYSNTSTPKKETIFKDIYPRSMKPKPKPKVETKVTETPKATPKETPKQPVKEPAQKVTNEEDEVYDIKDLLGDINLESLANITFDDKSSTSFTSDDDN